MPRKPRQLTEAGIYHIISRGNNKQLLFFETLDFEYYLSLLLRLRCAHRYDLYHYCLMTNHVHLLIRFYDAEGLQKVMQRINLNYAKYYKRKYVYHAHVFQDRFKSLAIDEDAYLLDCGRYIERNPLKAKLVKDPKEYAWSSYNFYAQGHQNSLINVNPLYEDLGERPEDRQNAYRAYVLTERPYEQLVEEGLAGL